MRSSRSVVAASLLVLSAACGSGSIAAGGTQQPFTEKDFDRTRFSASTKIDNQWFPLAPGTQFVYQGQANRGEGVLPHRVVFTVTDLKKVIDGVDTVVLWDRDFNEDVLAEEEITFHAQDDDGNVWNFGEYPEERENGRFVGAPSSWVSGVQRARAGLLMRGQPRVSRSTYLQGWAPHVEFRDRARVARRGAEECVPARCYRDLLVVNEWSPLEPVDGHQLKYYARGVGNVLVEPRGGEEQETLVLVDVIQLGPAELTEAREAARRLDRRAKIHAASVFRGTEPMVRIR